MGFIGGLVVGAVLLVGAAIGYAIYQSERRPEGSVAEFLKRPRPIGKRVAVIFGASTIHGRVGIDALPAVRRQLTQWEIVNAGHNGDTCAQLLARVDQVLACQPSAVVVETGGNDALGEESAESFAGSLAELVERIQASKARLGLCSFQVAGDVLSTAVNRRLDEYTQIMRRVATERNLGYLPLRERMKEELKVHPGGSAWEKKLGLVMISMLERHVLRRSLDEQSRRRGFRFNPDGLHLNTHGAELLSELIVEYLRDC